MRGISWLAAIPASFSRRTLHHGVSIDCIRLVFLIQIVLQFTVYPMWRLWLPALQTAVHVRRATSLSAALLTSLFLCYSRRAQQWQEQLDDEEMCLLLGVFCWFVVIINLQSQYESFFFINTLRTGLLNCLNARSRGLTFRHRASCI